MADQTEPQHEGPLVVGDRLKCPWCLGWEHIWNYTELQLPPGHTKKSKDVGPIYKCPKTGCKKLFAPRAA